MCKIKTLYYASLIISLIFRVRATQGEFVTTEHRQEILESLFNELSIKNVFIVKSVMTQHYSDSLLKFVKYFSRGNIYFCFLSVSEMGEKMRSYYQGSGHYYKTLVLSREDSLCHLLTEENEYAVSKFIWIYWNSTAIEKTLEDPYQSFYIPYNTQFIIVENSTESSYDLSEIYHPRLKSEIIFRTNFGKWSPNKGLQILENYFYRRRLDMNGTALPIVDTYVSKLKKA